ncbi:MAG TPA: tetratricopeptide repeat protein [Myxococcales bacterium]|nr:tetratricopeptide repeat protein [Myxococcales bacterium]
MRRLRPLLLAAAAGPIFACATATVSPDASLIHDIHERVHEKQRLIEKLKRDIQKVDRTIKVTKGLIVQSKTAPYLPDLFFRLAELYVEKSRYTFVLQAEESNTAVKTSSMIAPEVKLLKAKALQLYQRILSDFPDYKDSDKVRFYIAHEHRELGQFPEMIAAYDELIEKNPKSPLVDEATYILGDYWFDKGDQPKAESYYQQLLDRPKSPARQLAFYKMGWIRLFQKNLKESFKYFEAAVKNVPPAGTEKALDVRREALTELVYTYTEVKPAKDAIPYFEALADDSDMLTYILGKLGNRYWIKQEWANAAPVYRRLLQVNVDAERDADRAERLYECIRNARGKIIPTAEDVEVLVRVAARGRSDFRSTPEERRSIGSDFEIYARDLATKLQVAAQQAQDKKLEHNAARAYAAYLSLFRTRAQLSAMRHNYAEALFASDSNYVEAGRQYETLALAARGNDPGREDLLYSAILSYFTALGSKQPLSLYESVYARSGIEQLGAVYVRSYPRSPRASTVKFNVAKAYYDEGNFKKGGELFASYVSEFPSTKEAAIAANLALDSYHNLGDFEKLNAVAKSFMSNPALPASLISQIKTIASSSQGEELNEIALKGSENPNGDIAQSLLEFANAKAGSSVGELAMDTAFNTYRDQRDVPKMRDVAYKFIQQYPKSKLAANVLLSLGKFATEATDYQDAIQAFDEFARRFPDAPQTVDVLSTNAAMRVLLGDTERGVAEYERAIAAAPLSRRSELVGKIADAEMKAGDWARAQGAALRALQIDPANALAASILGKALLRENQLGEAQQKLAQAAQAIQNASRGAASDNEAAGNVFFLLGEALYRQFAALPADALEKKAGMIETLTQAYTGAAQLGSGEDAVAGLYRIGMVYQSIASDLEKTPEPAGLSPDQKIAFRNQLDQQVAPLKQQADEAFTTCLRKARDLDIVSPFTAGCRSKQAIEPAPIQPSFGSGGVDTSKTVEYRNRLLKSPEDIEALRGLAEADLATGDARRARLVLARLLELADSDPKAEADMGVALWKLGEVADASAAFHKALEQDPDEGVAKANLASMLCRYGDVEGARAKIQGGKLPPPSFNVDSGYLRCQ